MRAQLEAVRARRLMTLEGLVSAVVVQYGSLLPAKGARTEHAGALDFYSALRACIQGQTGSWYTGSNQKKHIASRGSCTP